MKNHSLNRNLGLQHLHQVPGNGLTLAVFIGSEIELVCVFQGGLQVANGFALAGRNGIHRLEVVFDVYRELANRGLLELRRHVFGVDQITDVPNRGQDLEIVAQVLANGFGFGRRLDDDQFSAICHALLLVSVAPDSTRPRRSFYLDADHCRTQPYK